MWFFTHDRSGSLSTGGDPDDFFANPDRLVELHSDIEIVSGGGSIFEDVNENPGASRALERVLAGKSGVSFNYSAGH